MVKCMYIKNIKDTQVYVGAISGASFVDGATGCKIHLQSHQIRIHNSKEVTFYLTARSSPIIEHCSQMTFSPYIDSESGKPALMFAGWEEVS
jgi:tubulin-specific chaperone C